MNTAGLVLGLPYEQSGQGQDDKQGDVDDELFHDLIPRLHTEQGFNQLFGISLAVKSVDGIVGHF